MIKIPSEERKLNKEQEKAVRYGDGPLLIIAGAGTGKTTVITERIKYLIASKKAKPREILALTFTEKASREMEDRVEIGLPYGIPEMWISTFHSFCDRILRAEAINIGLDPGYKLMTEAETIQFFQKHLFSFDLDYFRPLGNPTKFIRGMLQHFSRLKDEDVSPSQYFEWVRAKGSLKNSKINKDKENKTEDNKKYSELAGVYRKYEELKVKEGMVDYSDLIANTLKLFRIRPKILHSYRKQFRYVLIDEFQDTNFAQNELAILLAGPKKNITVVGDDDQAIYRWRGAAVSNIIQFRKRFAGCKVIVLTKNYRSTKEILNRSYDLIQNNNPDRLEVAAHISKKLESMRGISGEPIEVIMEDRVENEADAVVAGIKELIETKDKRYTWSDAAILVRANNHAEPFTRAFARAGIPYQFLGPGQLFRQGEVKDLIAYLKVLYAFDDSVAFYRVISMDIFGINPRDIAALLTYAKRYGISVFESAELAVRMEISGVSEGIPRPTLSEEGKKKLTFCVSMMHRHMKAMKEDTAGQILYYFLEETGLLAKLASIHSVKEEKIAGNIAKFFDKLKLYETNHEDASVMAVVDWIELSMSLGESPLSAEFDWTTNNAVNILTVHSAKGLEFPMVFLVNLVGARFPGVDKKEQIPIPDDLVKEILPVGDPHTEEERRLFYVGMTRARDHLFLTGAKYYGDGKREKKLSAFVGEAIGKEKIALFMKPGTEKATDIQLTLLEWKKSANDRSDMPVREPFHYLSHSQLETFETCPLQYKYRYILSIPVPSSSALTFGDVMHRTMKRFYEEIKKGSSGTLDLLRSSFHDAWSSVGYGNKKYEEKMKNHGEVLLEQFFKNGFDPKVIPDSMEEAFKIRITPTLSLGGRIDRIDIRKDGKFEIIDYKTGTTPKNRDVGTDRQLTVYALAATDPGLYGKSPGDVIVSFYYFEDSQKVSAVRTREQLETVKKEIAAKADEMSKSDFSPTPGKICDFCQYRLICEAWS